MLTTKSEFRILQTENKIRLNHMFPETPTFAHLVTGVWILSTKANLRAWGQHFTGSCVASSSRFRLGGGGGGGGRSSGVGRPATHTLGWGGGVGLREDQESSRRLKKWSRGKNRTGRRRANVGFPVNMSCRKHRATKIGKTTCCIEVVPKTSFV